MGLTATSALVLAAFTLTACGPAATPRATPGDATTGTPTAGTREVRVDRAPLASGLPRDADAEPAPGLGLRGPSRRVPPPEVRVCDAPVEVAGYADRVGVVWTDVEDHRARELLAFESPAAAAALVERLVTAWEACPRHDTDDGFAVVHTTRGLGLGDHGRSLLTWHERGTAPGIGLTVLHVVRVRDHVLLDLTSNEGSEASADEQVRRQATALRPVVVALCGSDC